MLSKQEAIRLLSEQVSQKDRRRRMMAVSAVMRGLAKRLHADEREWELVGLLHDIDLDKIGGDMNRHGLAASEMLDGKLSEAGLHAIRAHELSQIRVDTLKDKFRDESFAYLKNRPYLRNLIRVCEEIGLPLEEFFHLALKSLQGVSDELGL